VRRACAKVERAEEVGHAAAPVIFGGALTDSARAMCTGNISRMIGPPSFVETKAMAAASDPMIGEPDIPTSS